MSDIQFQSYIPRFLVNLNRDNGSVINVSTRYFSPEGDVYLLDKRTVSQTVIQTTQSLQELRPEVSDVYPFAIVPPKDADGSTILESPSVQTFPTASQLYYAPIVFERYQQSVMASINKTFTELTLTPVLEDVE